MISSLIFNYEQVPRPKTPLNSRPRLTPSLRPSKSKSIKWDEYSLFKSPSKNPRSPCGEYFVQIKTPEVLFYCQRVLIVDTYFIQIKTPEDLSRRFSYTSHGAYRAPLAPDIQNNSHKYRSPRGSTSLLRKLSREATRSIEILKQCYIFKPKFSDLRQLPSAITN